MADRVGIRVSSNGLIKIVECTPSKETLSLPIANNYPSIDAGIQFMPIVVEKQEDPIDPEISRLQKLEDVDFKIKDATLAAAIQLCATSCNMKYMAPPDDAHFNTLITLSIQNNPYHVLELLCTTYNIGFEHNNGIWQFYPIKLNELIQKTYKLKYNDQEQVKITSPNINTSIAQSNAAGLGGNATPVSSDVFSIKTNVVVEEIEKILALPTTGIKAIDLNEKIDSPSQSNLKSTTPPKESVLYSSDNNTLNIVATRQHHSYIENYLKDVDQPQRLIKIEALFVETSQNQGFNFKDKPDPFPATDMTEILNSIQSAPESSIIGSTIVTTNNKSVAFKSVIQQPIESGNTQTVNPDSCDNVSIVNYVEIGTILNVHPKIMDDSASNSDLKSVVLNVSLVVSNEIGKQLIGDKEYPIISSVTYECIVIIPSGKTLEIGGLSHIYSSTTDKSVPILCNIPIIGTAFSKKSHTQHKRNLIAYITPTIFN